MRRILGSAFLASALALAAPASAAIIVDEHPYENPDPLVGIHNVANQSGTTVTGYLNGTTLLYDFGSTPVETLAINGSGHATVEALDGGMYALTMTPQDPAGNFSAIDFNVGVPTGATLRDVKAVGPVADWVSFHLVLSDDSVWNSGPYELGGNNMFLIFGNAGEVFKSITWRGWTDDDMLTAAQFHDVRQIDLNPALAPVPEPTTWAMMIAGFGLVGAAMRRRKQTRPGAGLAMA